MVQLVHVYKTVTSVRISIRLFNESAGFLDQDSGSSKNNLKDRIEVSFK